MTNVHEAGVFSPAEVSYLRANGYKRDKNSESSFATPGQAYRKNFGKGDYRKSEGHSALITTQKADQFGPGGLESMYRNNSGSGDWYFKSHKTVEDAVAHISKKMQKYA